jgi:peptidoglycan/LPS O-acetylase OafA/YrhL
MASASRLLLQDFGTGSAAMFGATLVFIVVLSSLRTQRVLELRSLRYIGRISYALYALHFLVLGSLSASIYLLVRPIAAHEVAAIASMCTAVLCLLPAAHLLTISVDRWAIALSGWIAERIIVPIRDTQKGARSSPSRPEPMILPRPARLSERLGTRP